MSQIVSPCLNGKSQTSMVKPPVFGRCFQLFSAGYGCGDLLIPDLLGIGLGRWGWRCLKMRYPKSIMLRNVIQNVNHHGFWIIHDNPITYVTYGLIFMLSKIPNPLVNQWENHVCFPSKLDMWPGYSPISDEAMWGWVKL